MKIIKSILISLMLVFALAPVYVSAHAGEAVDVNAENATTTEVDIQEETGAGITPDNIFYFLDRLGENLREFFTFNPEAKAKLQIKFAGERISEISVMVEKKGANTKGIEKAKTLLLGNVAYAAEIIKEEKTIGKDVSTLAKEIDDAFDEQEKLLTQIFQEARKKLKENRLALKQDLTGVDDLDIETQIQLLEDEADGLRDIQDDLENLFDDEQEKIEEELDDEDKERDELEEKEDERKDAEESIQEASKEKQETIEEARDEEDEIDNEDDESDSDEGDGEDEEEDDDSLDDIE